MGKRRVNKTFGFVSLEKNPSINGTDGFLRSKNPIRHTTTVYSVYERGMPHLAMAGFFQFFIIYLTILKTKIYK